MDLPSDARHEIKFTAPRRELHRVKAWLDHSDAGFLESHPARRVNNVYFDSYDYRALAENLSGTSTRIKQRYRWYGESDLPDSGQLEFKIKRNVFGWKKIFPSTQTLLRPGENWREARTRLRSMVSADWRALFDENTQVVFLSRYQRCYFSARSTNIRVTLDANYRVYDQRYATAPKLGRASKLPDSIIVEFKFPRSEREAVSKTLQGFPFRVYRYSKYVSGVMAISSY